MVRYYQISEPNSEAGSVGIIKVVNGEFPIPLINKAINSHLDEMVVIEKVEEFSNTGELEITVERESGERDVFTAVETWLYF